MSAPASPLAVLTHEFYPYRGGIAVYVEETARAATAAGHAVTLWAPDRPALRAQNWPFVVRPVTMRGTLGWPCRLATARAVSAARDELMQATVWLPEPGAVLTAMYLNYFGRLPARHLILTLHGSEILRFAQWPHRRTLFQKLLDRADRVGLVSGFNRRLLEQHFRANPAKIALVSGALRSDFGETKPARAPKTPDTPIVLLTVGRVHPRKGQHCVLEALALIAQKLPAPLEYRIAGPVVRPAYQRQLEALAKKSGVTVRFLGEVPDAALPAQYAEADIFVMTPVPHGPSVEGFGLAYLEAAAHGLPVVAHRTGGVPEAVREDITGLLADPDDRAELAAAIFELAHDCAKRARLGAAGGERLRELSWSANAKALFAGLD